MIRLSVIVPVYNEADTILSVVERIQSVDLDKEIIIVDDGSTDNTAARLHKLSDPRIKVIHHMTNRGKGAAIVTGMRQASGEFAIIQDADLEYDPAEYPALWAAISQGQIDILLGARFMRSYCGTPFQILGNRILTGMVNLFYGLQLNDSFTCYKMFRKDVFQLLGISETGFAVEAEIIAKAAKRGLRICEVPISYKPRTFAQGKKIRWHDGLRGIGIIFAVKFGQA